MVSVDGDEVEIGEIERLPAAAHDRLWHRPRVGDRERAGEMLGRRDAAVSAAEPLVSGGALLVRPQIQ